MRKNPSSQEVCALLKIGELAEDELLMMLEYITIVELFIVRLWRETVS